MLSWMSRTALELIGQAGLGYSFDPLVTDTADDIGYAIKIFQYVLSLASVSLVCQSSHDVAMTGPR